MTWAERVGDVATNVTLVFINVALVFTSITRLLFEKLDALVTSLGERSESGLTATGAPETAWVRITASVFLGVATVLLRVVSIATVLVRQLAVTADDFFKTLADGEARA